jgi:hypothetical protein
MPRYGFSNIYDDDEQQNDDMAISPSPSFEQPPPILPRWQELCNSLHQYVLDENLFLNCPRQESEYQQRLFANFIKDMYTFQVLDNDAEFAASHFAYALIYVRRAHVFRRSVTRKIAYCDARRTPITLYLMIVACFVIAAKIINDVPFDNQSYANLARVPLAAVNAAELYMMHLLDWDASVSHEEFAPVAGCNINCNNKTEFYS